MPSLTFLETSQVIGKRWPAATLIVVGVTEDVAWRPTEAGLHSRLVVVGRQFDLGTYHGAADIYFAQRSSLASILVILSSGLSGRRYSSACNRNSRTSSAKHASGKSHIANRAVRRWRGTTSFRP